MSENSLYAQRQRLFKDTIKLKNTERVPNLSNFFTWKILDSPYKLSQAMNDYKVMEKLVVDFHNRYQFDAYMDLGARNPLKVTDILGKGHHEVDDVKESVNYYDHVIMERDEYLEIAKDPNAFFWTKAFPRKYPNVKASTLQKSMQEFLMFAQFVMKMSDKFVTEYQCPSVFSMTGVALHPFEMFFSNLRGIKEVSIDLRKVKSEMIEAMEVMYEKFTKPVFNGVMVADTSAYVCDGYIALLGHSILSEKQFGEIYWPILKRVIDMFVANNKTLYVFCESTILRFKEFFQEVPKGYLVLHLEQDNIFEVRKQLPNHCLAGGMTTDLLGKGTPQQCVDYAKKLIDELGDGFIMSQNKMVSFRNDCKRENLIAVNNFVRNYRR